MRSQIRNFEYANRVVRSVRGVLALMFVDVDVEVAAYVANGACASAKDYPSTRSNHVPATDHGGIEIRPTSSCATNTSRC